MDGASTKLAVCATGKLKQFITIESTLLVLVSIGRYILIKIVETPTSF